MKLLGIYNYIVLINIIPSEVSKWLSGMHNLTRRNIVKMEEALGIHIDGFENTAANDSLCVKTLSASILARSGG